MNVLVVAIPVLVLLAAVLVYAALRRRDVDVAIGRLDRAARATDRSTSAAPFREAPPARARDVERQATQRRHPPPGPAEPRHAVVRAEAAPPARWEPPDEDTIGVTRRQFLNRSVVGSMAFALTAFGGASLAFLWPQGTGGFGSKIRVGSISDLLDQIRENDGFLYVPEGRMWLTEYPASALDKARRTYSAAELAGMERGVLALYQKCPHLGCRVPQCLTSQWFECPCHGSQYNQVGEKKGGPAPRGMDRFAMTVDGDQLTADTGIIIQGPPIGTNTTGQEAEGPHCVGGGGE
ncbi:MAG: ubiquinol-cytochrome c reductase iron-sulfur subunit [Acidimicrobiales bacterium]